MPRSHHLLLLALSSLASAFSDTSPYILLSPHSSIPAAARDQSFLPSSQFLNTARDVIKKCDADAYVIVSQPGVHIEDFAAAGVHMKDLVQEVGRKAWVADFVYADSQRADMGGVVEALQELAVGGCNAVVEGVDAKTATFKPFDGTRPRVVRVDFEALPAAAKARSHTLERHDAFLHSVLDLLPTRRFVLVFASSPISAPLTSSPAAPHKQAALELRSIEEKVVVLEKGGRNETNVGGLFHKYQFFTTPILMGYVAVTVMLVILYVGLSAISSVGVSYGSFDKEMGPAAQAAKKQQ
ncbi:BIG/ATPase V1 complex, subunit S1 [Sphaerosporella brunnea]|uniref:Protein BIG1 n=1 Tax=Sphaerosporella brunnea TaxID=1250544 RepID=A0A5J5F1G6_9PEZI|nr:BIG/ATPase V1 complex, subunit S1 [Sphaerosporella brunnea]